MLLEFDTEEVELPTYPDGEHPLEIFMHGDAETRSDVILNHPDVLGFVYLNDDVITKAFLPKKVVNFKTKSKVIVAVSGDTEEYTPFSVHESQLVSDSLHLTDFNNFTAGAAIISVGKHLKDNAADLPALPNVFSSDAKVKKSYYRLPTCSTCRQRIRHSRRRDRWQRYLRQIWPDPRLLRRLDISIQQKVRPR